MIDQELMSVLICSTNLGYGIVIEGDRAKEALNMAKEAINKLDKIQTITERALRSSDPINLYKALCINEIAEILGVKVEDPAEKKEDKGQITFDDII